MEGGKVKRRGGGKGEKRGYRGIWDEGGTERFREKIGRVEFRGEGIQREMDEVGMRIREAMKGIEEERGKERYIRRGWWDEECRVKKRRVRRSLREWTDGRGGGQEYRKEKREYNKICEKKRQEENEKWEREAQEARTEGQVWRVINRERRKRRRINGEIRMEEWEEYFKSVLGGTENRVVVEKGGKI